MYLRYGIPRGLRSLRTNWKANFNTILILSSSLSVLGMIALLYLNLTHFSEIWFSNSKISLFLDSGIEAERRTALLEQVRGLELVRKAELITPREGLKALSETLGTNQNILAGAGVEGIPYTIDLELRVGHQEQIGGVARSLANLPGVEDVLYTERRLREVRMFFTVLQGVGGFFIALILTSLFLIVSHATKLSLHSRREEIEILSLVGATRGFIRSSVIVEGLLIALAGGLFSVLTIWICFLFLRAGLSWKELTSSLQGEAIFFSLRDLMYALGAASLLGAVSSYFAVNKLLKDMET